MSPQEKAKRSMLLGLKYYAYIFRLDIFIALKEEFGKNPNCNIS
jgi:hypothetical protein